MGDAEGLVDLSIGSMWLSSGATSIAPSAISRTA